MLYSAQEHRDSWYRHNVECAKAEVRRKNHKVWRQCMKYWFWHPALGFWELANKYAQHRRQVLQAEEERLHELQNAEGAPLLNERWVEQNPTEAARACMGMTNARACSMPG